MKKTCVVIPWQSGLHLRLAARLVRLTRGFHSHVWLNVGGRVAEASSVLNILLLCAAMNTALEIEAVGPDEQEAVQVVEAFFSMDDGQDGTAADILPV